MTRTWLPPWAISGNPDHLRVSVTLLAGSADRHCPEQRALKARPDVWPETPFAERRYGRFATFLIGVIRDCVLAAEHGDVPVDPVEAWDAVAARALTQVLEADLVQGELPEAARGWVRQAVETYLETAEVLNRPDDLVPGPRDGWVVLHHAGHEISELVAWGLFYSSADGQLREMRLLRVKPAADRRPMPESAVAAAAFVVAAGIRPQSGTRWRDPYEVSTPPDPLPSTVRVREVALLDGTDQIVWEGTPGDAHAMWAPFGGSLVRPLISGGGLVPCRDCEKCKARAVCDALPVSPGLLGLPGFGSHPRTLAPTALDLWARCPARYLYTKELNLPRGETVSTAALERGTAVHRWLEHAHRRTAPCTLEDLTAPPTDRSSNGLVGVAEAAQLTLDEYTAAYPYLRQHLDHCPLATDGVLHAWPERDLAVFDSDADVLVLHRPDVLLARANGPLWRETKTVARLPEASDADLLASFPQVAVAVCVLADNATGDPRLATGIADAGASAIVELELLGPDASRLVRFDALAEETLAMARRSIARAAYGWHRDSDFSPRPGVWCQGCEVNRWCPTAQLDGPRPPRRGVLQGGESIAQPVVVDGVVVDQRTGEVLDDDGNVRTPTAVEAVIAASLLGSSSDPDDEIPF